MASRTVRAVDGSPPQIGTKTARTMRAARVKRKTTKNIITTKIRADLPVNLPRPNATDLAPGNYRWFWQLSNGRVRRGWFTVEKP